VISEINIDSAKSYMTTSSIAFPPTAKKEQA